MTVCQLTPFESTYAIEGEPIEENNVILLEEDESLREEYSKTFILSDKTYQKIIYSIPVHYKEDDEWKEIEEVEIEEISSEEVSTQLEESNIQENTESLELNTEMNEEDDISMTHQDEVLENSNQQIEESNEINTSLNEEEIIEANDSFVNEENNELPEIIETEEVIQQPATEIIEIESNNDTQVVGYKNKKGNLDMKFSKKAHSKNMVSIKDGDYRVSWGFVDLDHKSYGIVGQTSQSDDLIESAYNHISQQIKYSDVISGVDLVYNIDSLGIKENIMIHQPTDVNTFTFEYKVNGLELILNDDGDIEAINEDNDIIFLMSKPYMYDKEGNYCEDVHYEISQKNKKYTITIVADKEWLNSEDRVYPITIDPVIQTQQTANAIKSTFIASGWYNTNFNHHFELLVGRESSAYQNCRSLFQFSLPALNRGDMVIDAKFYVAQYYHSFYTSSTPNLQVNAHMLNTSWTDTSVTWNSIKGSGNENSYYDNHVLDYDYIKRSDTQNAANWKVFDVTTAVKKWYDGTPNNGILLKSYNEAGSHSAVGVKGQFWPEDYNNSYNAFPFISIAYRNNKGIESYHDYTSFSTYSAGNVYVDNYSGNLVVEHQDASTYGNLAPVTVSHIYNGYMATQNPYNVGKGWKLNIHQTLKPSSQYGLTGESATTYPYVYMDQDGTEHYFIKKDNEYFDEDGLGLELKVVSGGYTITDKQDNVMTFNSYGDITSIKDNYNHTISYTYEDDLITKVTSGNGQEIILTYENGLLSKITDQAGKESTYQYTDNLLT